MDLDNASGTEDGTSWVTAFTAIQAAVDAAFDDGGGEVWVAVGEYGSPTPQGDLPTVEMKEGVDIFGGFMGSEAARADRDWEQHVVVVTGGEFSTSSVVIGADSAAFDGFTLTGGVVDCDSGLCSSIFYNVSVSPTIRNCTFTNNVGVLEGGLVLDPDESGMGVAIYNENSQVTISNCLFFRNDLESAFFNPELEIPSAVVFNLNSSIAINNCIFSENQGTSIFSINTLLTASNCTFAGNLLSSDLGPDFPTYTLVAESNSRFDITNSIIFEIFDTPIAESRLERGSQTEGSFRVFDQVTASAAYDIDYSNITGGFEGVGNIDSDPLFAGFVRPVSIFSATLFGRNPRTSIFSRDPRTSMFNLRVASPCIDAGVTAADVLFDVSGLPRPQGLAYDMGAYEFQDEDGDGMADNWELHHGFDPTDVSDSSIDSDNDGLSNLSEYEIATDPLDGKDPRFQVFVSVSGDDESGDGTEEAPWRTIGFVMDQAVSQPSNWPDTIINVSPGTFQEQILFAPNVTVKGSGETTIVEYFDPAASEHVIVVGAENSSLRDCTVRLPETTTDITTQIRIEDVSMEVSNVTIDGGGNLTSFGIFITGPNSSGSRIVGSTIKNLQFGVQAVDTAANLSRNTFENIETLAVFVKGPEQRKQDDSTPLLGDSGDIATSGFNRFRNIKGLFVQNDNPELTVAEVNDWGVYTKDEIETGITGSVDILPFLDKALVSESLVVQVLDQRTQQPISAMNNPRVSIDKPNVFQLVSETSGLAFFVPLEAGTFRVTATADGYKEGILENVVVRAGKFEAVGISTRISHLEESS